MKVEGGGKYQVKLVPANCHREEVVFEVISALDHLNTITHEIFTKLRTRIAEQNTQVLTYNLRISAAANKVSEYKSSPKAIQILSPAKFPEESDELKTPNLYPVLQLKSLPKQKTMTDSEEIMSRIKSKRILYESPVKHTDELLQYYRVRDFNYSKGSNLGQLGTQYELGLGNPPNELDRIDSFFLFNTAENPYQNYHVFERHGTLIGTKVTRKLEHSIDTNGKHDSDARNDDEGEMPAVGNELLDDFFYYPSSVQIPNIDVPDHLPELAGLFDTLNFPSTESSPSEFSFQRSTSTPTISSTRTPPIQITQSIYTRDTTEPERLVSTTSILPLPPPPPPPPLPPMLFSQPTVAPSTQAVATSMPSSQPSIPSSTPLAQSFVQSPPPPPPPALQDGSKPTSKINISDSLKSGGGGPDLRTNLMAAIREAGGKSKLKSAQDIRSESRKKKQEEKEKLEVGNAGNLMADLKNSLAMRRRGISGMNDSRRQPGLGDIMQKIASTIPMNEGSIESSHGGNLSEDDDWD